MNAHQRRKARRNPQGFETISTPDARGKWTSRRRRVPADTWTAPPLRGPLVPFPRHVTVMVDRDADGADHTVMLDTSDPANVKVWAAFKTEASHG